MGGIAIFLLLATSFISMQAITGSLTIQELLVETRAETENEAVLTTDTLYSALTYNIGFGAYTPGFQLFWMEANLPLGQKQR